MLQEDQLVRVLEKNTELTIQNTDLHKQVLQLQHVSEFIYSYYLKTLFFLKLSLARIFC